MKDLYKALATLVLCVFGIFYRFFVIVKVWSYVAVKMFGANPIGMWKAFALACLVGTFTLNYRDLEDRKKKEIDEHLKDILKYTAALTFSWFVDWLLFG